MKSKLILKLAALGGMMLVLLVLLALAPGTKTGVVKAGASAPAPLLSCPNVNGSDDDVHDVQIDDILAVVSHYYQSYGQPGYSLLYDNIDPYNPQAPADTGLIDITDIVYIVDHYFDDCSPVDAQIAKATLAISDPTFSDVLCDDAGVVKYQNPVNCGGDTRFLTEDPTFLASRGYRRGSFDVPGQGIHYVNFSLWDGVFNPVRPEGLVYKGGVLAAQLYYAEGDVIGWGSNPTSNRHAVNTDALPCSASAQEPPGVGCSWDGAFDGWHWHDHLCTFGIGTPQAQALASPAFSSQAVCASYASSQGVTCVFPNVDPINFNCTWKAAAGWMGHLWNRLPNVNFTNAVNTSGLGLCQVALCSTGESNGRFADCFPDTGNYNAYDCPS